MNFDLKCSFCLNAVIYTPYISNGIVILDPRVSRWFNNPKKIRSLKLFVTWRAPILRFCFFQSSSVPLGRTPMFDGLGWFPYQATLLGLFFPVLDTFRGFGIQLLGTAGRPALLSQRQDHDSSAHRSLTDQQRVVGLDLA
jgi:hypothetical protein